MTIHLFKKGNKQQKGCQIDYLIHTRYKMLFVIEIKFSRDPVGTTVIEEVEQKLKSLKLPRGYSCNPVLVHLNGVTESLVEREFFTNIIDFSKILD